VTAFKLFRKVSTINPNFLKFDVNNPACPPENGSDRAKLWTGRREDGKTGGRGDGRTGRTPEEFHVYRRGSNQFHFPLPDEKLTMKHKYITGRGKGRGAVDFSIFVFLFSFFISFFIFHFIFDF
jgi:hypothetical protein